jgi:putative ABC transport system permease protein
MKLPTTFWFYLKWAFQSLRNNAIRSLLTALGVAVAVAILIGILGFYRGYRDSLAESIEHLGFHVLVTAKGCPYEAATLILRGGQIPMYVDEQIYQEIARHPEVDFISKLFLQTLPADDGDRFHFFMGIEDTFLSMKPWLSFQRGRWFSADEPNGIILGFNVASYLGKDIGDELRFEQFRDSFKVVGILDRSGSQDDGTIFMQLQTAQKLFDRRNKLTGLGIRVKDVQKLDQFVEEIYDLPSVQVIATAQIQSTLLRLVDSMRSLMLTVSLCAILIAAMALMNTVLMSVFERTKEFGIVRAMGGGRRHLFGIVSLETAVLALIGAALGVAVVFVFGNSAEWFLRYLLPFAPSGDILQITWVERLAVLSSAVVAGILCSLYPALRASRIPPVESLRYGE